MVQVEATIEHLIEENIQLRQDNAEHIDMIRDLEYQRAEQDIEILRLKAEIYDLLKEAGKC
jgi:hypothetical protein